MIDLRQGLSEILRDYGHPILYQRSNRKIRCKCWDNRWREADPRCPICLGSGWLIRLERHIVRGNNAMQTVTYPNLHEESPIGNSWVPADVLYVKYSVHPRVGDVVIEVGWKGLRPTNVRYVYEVNHIQPNRGDNGRIEFYEMYIKSIPFDSSKYKIALKKYGSVITYEIPGS